MTMTKQQNLQTYIEEAMKSFDAEFGDCDGYKPEHYKGIFELHLRKIALSAIQAVEPEKVGDDQAFGTFSMPDKNAGWNLCRRAVLSAKEEFLK